MWINGGSFACDERSLEFRPSLPPASTKRVGKFFHYRREVQIYLKIKKNLKESEEGHMGGLDGKKGKRKTLQSKYNLKNKQKKKLTSMMHTVFPRYAKIHLTNLKYNGQYIM